MAATITARERLKLLQLGILAMGAPSPAAASDTLDWKLTNGLLEAEFQYSLDTLRFSCKALRLVSGASSGMVWTPPAGMPISPMRLTISGETYNAWSRYRLVESVYEPAPRQGQRLRIELEDQFGRLRFTLKLDVYPGHPVLHQTVEVRALTTRQSITAADMLPWTLAADDRSFRVFRVNQWAIVPRETNFEPVENRLAEDGAAIGLRSGSGGLHCSWLALRDQRDNGLFFGWEFNGRAAVSVRHQSDRGRLLLTSAIEELEHPIEPGDPFEVPPSFVGLFNGDWDEAGYRTQRFAEDALAAPMPASSSGREFPYVAWDSWGYQREINEAMLRRSAEIAAQLGIELFVVDLGWAQRMGDWRPDPAKFPSGLRALSDYVHSLGMKFGLHFVPAEADPQSRVLLDHPEWRSSRTYLYHGADSLCPSHAPARQWVIDEAVRVIEEYNVDWILQDGQTLVKECTRTDHTHHPDDSNYANSVDGVDYILAEVQRRAPRAVWENCANGGSMMTFKMLRQYVTSITNDASGALGARQGMFGATFPFPSRYSDRYMPETDIDPYVTRSFIFGGPWVFMNKLAEMTAEDLELARKEIAAFKDIRKTVRDGRIYHLTARPAEGRVDAIQALDARDGSSVVVVTRERSAGARFALRPRGLKPDQAYTVTFADDRRILTLSGRQLAAGLQIEFDEARDSEIVYIDPVSS
jgi:hypothetical protein